MRVPVRAAHGGGHAADALCRPSREVLGSNASVSRALLQRLQQLQRCEGGEGGVEIKRHVTKALAAVRSAAARDPRAGAEDDEFFPRQDARPEQAAAAAQAADHAAPAPASSSLMSLKAQRVTSGALPPPPSLSLPWATSSHHSAAPHIPAAAAHSQAATARLNGSDCNPAHNPCAEAAEAPTPACSAEAPAPAYSAQRYNARAADVRAGDEAEGEGRAAVPDDSEAKWPDHKADQTAKELQHRGAMREAAAAAWQTQAVPSLLPPGTPPTAAARPASPSPSASRSSPSLPSLLDSIALASAGQSADLSRDHSPHTLPCRNAKHALNCSERARCLHRRCCCRRQRVQRPLCRARSHPAAPAPRRHGRQRHRRRPVRAAGAPLPALFRV